MSDYYDGYRAAANASDLNSSLNGSHVARIWGFHHK